MASKNVSKENLVTSSLMIVNNPVSENMSMYYPDSPCTTQPTTSASATSTSEEYNYMYSEHAHSNSGPFSYGTYYPYHYDNRGQGYVAGSSRDCSCRSVPPKESFLHQILVGKGYTNDRLFVSTRPVIKQERDRYYDYGCCYGYPVGYGYPTY